MIKDESGPGLPKELLEELDPQKQKDETMREHSWKRSERYRRKGSLVGCDICHSLRGTFRKDPYVKEDAVYCENCWPVVMQKRYGGKVVVKK